MLLDIDTARLVRVHMLTSLVNRVPGAEPINQARIIEDFTTAIQDCQCESEIAKIYQPIADKIQTLLSVQELRK